VLLGGLGAAVGPAEAVTLIPNCPYTIMQPGVYVLASDLSCPGGTAITVAADNVVFNLNGRTLTGDGDGVGVSAEGSEADPITGLRVENGTVRGFFDGVRVGNAPGARVANVTATGNDDDGIEVYASPGARIEGNTLTGNGFGLLVDGCEGGCRIAGNRVADNGRGILIRDATGARIEGNTATGNGSDGIALSGDASTGNQVRGNTATGNGESGIEVEVDSTGNTLEGNTATGNDADRDGDPDLVDRNLPADPCPSTWRGNNFVTDNEGDGPSAGCIR
jgi:parallel beta-helix repeat protein